MLVFDLAYPNYEPKVVGITGFLILQKVLKISTELKLYLFLLNMAKVWVTDEKSYMFIFVFMLSLNCVVQIVISLNVLVINSESPITHQCHIIERDHPFSWCN